MPNFSFLVCLELEVLWLERTTQTKNNSVKLEASLAPAEAEVGAVAMADQHVPKFVINVCFEREETALVMSKSK